MGAFSSIELDQSYMQGGAPAAEAQTVAASPFISSAFSAPPPPPPPPQQPKAQQPAASSPTQSAAVEDKTTSAASPSQVPLAQRTDTAPTAQATPVKTATSDEQPKSNTDDDEAAKRKAHDEAEAKRKAEHDAKFAERRAKEQAERNRVAGLADDAVMSEAMSRVSKGFEQLTRRNMKDCVSEYIQTACIGDPAFARNVMNPVKSMVNCVKYINNKAREYVKKEMEDNDMKPDQGGIYGCDVPDDLVYQWAVDYFNDPNAKEDEREDEKFTPKPYVGGRTTKSKKDKDKDKDKEKAKKEAEKKAAEKKAAEEKAKQKADDGQMSLLGAA